MSKIPTVKEFLKGRPWKNGMNLQERIHESMIQFAKLHVEAALLAAEEEVDGGLSYVYPLENIK